MTISITRAGTGASHLPALPLLAPRQRLKAPPVLPPPKLAHSLRHLYNIGLSCYYGVVSTGCTLQSIRMEHTKVAQTHQNIYTSQEKPKTPAPKTRYVRQDKGGFKTARAGSRQPAPLLKESRAKRTNTNTHRSQKRISTLVKLVHTTLWIHPPVKGPNLAKPKNLAK